MSGRHVNVMTSMTRARNDIERQGRTFSSIASSILLFDFVFWLQPVVDALAVPFAALFFSVAEVVFHSSGSAALVGGSWCK